MSISIHHPEYVWYHHGHFFKFIIYNIKYDIAFHNPEFHSDWMDHKMHYRLMSAVEERDVRLFPNRVEIVLCELLANQWLAEFKDFTFKFKEYNNTCLDRIIRFHENNSVSFQIALLKVGSG